MADDIDIKDASNATVAVATRDKGGREVQLVQLDLGNGSTVSPAEGAVPISAASLPLPSGAASASNQATANAALGAPADAEATGDGSIVALLKRIRTRIGDVATALAGTLTVGGTVAVSNFPGTQAVSGPLTDTQLRAASVPVSGPLTDTELRATAVPVSGTFWQATQPVSASALPLPAGASTEATLAALNAKFAALSDGRVPTVDAAYEAVFGKMLVGTARDKFRDEFATFDATNNWEVVQTGAGMTISTAGAANGARYLNVATGTTINSETIILSRATFKLPVKLACALSMSQRIANQEAFVELVGVGGTGAVETDTSIAASANLNNATNAAALKWDGTTAANALSIVRGYGISEIAQASSAYVTTAATGTNPNFIPAGIFEINADMEEVVFGARNIDSVAALTGVNKRTQYICDPTKDYKVRIRVRNLGTAPASTTDVRIHNVRVLDTTRFTVDWARHMGRTSDIADSLPVAITSAATVPVSIATNTPALAAGTNLAADFGVQYRANATGAASGAHIVSAASTNATVVKASAGRVLGWSIGNTSAAWRYVKLHNQTTTPTAGSGVARTIAIPPGGLAQAQLPGGIAFATGIGLTIVTGAADSDATAVAANDVVGELFFA